MRAAGVVLAVLFCVALTSCESQEPSGGSGDSMQVFRLVLDVMMSLIGTIVQALVSSMRY